ncbi:hypothetical protein KKB69_00775 [Patescibacteria group bacterium]|nr:hypothetical protein [Patescibacteria group bacterium]
MQKGFSFIGVMVATFIASIGMVALFSLSIMSLKGASVGEMRLIASGLAQEGIEIVRDVRAINIEWSNWEWYSTSTPMVHPVGSSAAYCVQYNSTALFSCGEIPLKLNKTTMLYQYDSGDNSPFYRKVILTRISNNQVKVAVEVKWKLIGSDTSWHSLVAEDRLWKWR